MLKKEVIFKLINLEKDIEEIKNINRGGCAIVAFKIADKLLKMNFKGFQFIISGFEIDDNYQYTNCDHMWIRIGKYNFNQHGYDNKKITVIDKPYIFMNELNRSIRKKTNWNPKYNRKKQNKKLNNLINKYFK